MIYLHIIYIYITYIYNIYIYIYIYIYIIYFILYIIYTQEIHSSVLGDKAKCKHSAFIKNVQMYTEKQSLDIKSISIYRKQWNI